MENREEVEVYCYNYDYKTGKHSIPHRLATIDENGVAHIKVNPVNKSEILKRNPGEYIRSEVMTHDFRRAMRETIKAELYEELKKEIKGEKV